jgi:hypothetical protein
MVQRLLCHYTSTFVDSSGWYALIDRRDGAHGRARQVVRQLLTSAGRLLTTDYVLDESFMLACARAGPIAGQRLLDLVEQRRALDTEWVGPERFATARAFFRKHLDQGYSFTDCTSFVVMEEMKLSRALTTDEHFRRRGFDALLIG